MPGRSCEGGSSSSSRGGNGGGSGGDGGHSGGGCDRTRIHPLEAMAPPARSPEEQGMVIEDVGDDELETRMRPDPGRAQQNL